jgi:putative hydrolase of the HAD superfamily
MNILWDFDGILAYRDGMWSGTLFSVLDKNNIKNISLENIKSYLSAGFTRVWLRRRHCCLFPP